MNNYLLMLMASACLTTARASELIESAKRGDLQAVQKAIAEGAAVDSKYSLGQTLLQIACACGYESIVEYLISQGANVNHVDKYGSSVLMEACTSSNAANVKRLLKAGVEVNYQNNYGDSALTIALNNMKDYYMIERDSVVAQIVKDLIHAGAQINLRTHPGIDALPKACSLGDTELITLLLNIGADPNQVSFEDTPLTRCLEKNCHNCDEVIKILARAGADLNCRKTVGSPFGRTPLMIAVMRQMTDVVRLLIQLGVDVHATDSEGQNSLYHALCNDDSKTIELLLDAGITINDQQCNKYATGFKTNRAIVHARNFTQDPFNFIERAEDNDQALKKYLRWSIAYKLPHAYSRIKELRPAWFADRAQIGRLFIFAIRLGNNFVAKDLAQAIKKLPLQARLQLWSQFIQNTKLDPQVAQELITELVSSDFLAH